jgi:hypothetical protein
VGLLQCEEDVERLLLENVGNDFKKGEQLDYVYAFSIYLLLSFLKCSTLISSFLFLNIFVAVNSIQTFLPYFLPVYLTFNLLLTFSSYYYSFLPLLFMQVCVTSEQPAPLGKLRADTDLVPAIPMIKRQTHR